MHTPLASLDNQPVHRAGQLSLLAVRGRSGTGHKEEVVSPEEHLHAADDRTTPLGKGAGPVSFVVCYGAEGVRPSGL